MSDNNNNIGFEPLPLKRRVITSADVNEYCVRAGSGETRQIKANTAYEAFRMSGFATAVKIERLFVLDRIIMDKAKIKETSAGEERQDAFLPDGALDMDAQVSRRDIVTADELDEIIRKWRVRQEKLAVQSTKQEPPSAPPPAVVEAAPPAAAIEPPAAVTAPVVAETMPFVVPPPQPVTIPPSGQIAAIGMDVQGDGFDEIIPAPPTAPLPSLSNKHVEPRAAAPEPAVTPAADASGLPPERELSPEEVEKLLSGKP